MNNYRFFTLWSVFMLAVFFMAVVYCNVFVMFTCAGYLLVLAISAWLEVDIHALVKELENGK